MAGDVATTATAGPTDWAQGIADTIALLQYEAEAMLADPFGSIQAALDTGVNTVFDTLDQWLSSLPANPISDYLSGALLLVRRGLFDQVATADPVTDILRANGQWKGSLNPVDSMDEVPTYTVTDTPDHGSVQINADGTYVYTPDEGYIGPDSFKVKAADPGFNIFDIFGPRDPDFTVPVGDTKFLAPTIKNVGGEVLVVNRIIYEIGNFRATRQRQDWQADRVEPGDTYYVKKIDPVVGAPAPGTFYSYRVFVTSDSACDGLICLYFPVPALDLWTIEFTQLQGSSKTTATVFPDAAAKYSTYEIVDSSWSYDTNTSQQVRLAFVLPSNPPAPGT